MARINWDGEKKINLALQGGGSHGAFTWGVLDALLEDKRLDIEAITGTSAGAMNAVALAQGFLEGGREGARQKLESFWAAIANVGALSASQRDLVGRFFGNFLFDSSPMQAWWNFATQFSSPYQTNPLNINPLRDLIDDLVDFEQVRACEQIQLFIAATHVHSGRIAIFERQHLTADHVMASACLPLMFQAVEIEGTPYWDGGYLGNPALFPLFYKSQSQDILIVQINPIIRDEIPQSVNDIQNRLNEITFNSSLMGELRAIDFVNRLIDQGKLSPDDYMHPLMHRIDGHNIIDQFSADSKLDTQWAFLLELRDGGRKAANMWLKDNYDSIGKQATLDLRFAYGSKGQQLPHENPSREN